MGSKGIKGGQKGSPLENISKKLKELWEEIVDRALDLWDSFKRLNPKIQVGIVGGVVFLIAIIVLVSFLYTPELPINAVQDTSMVLGGIFIAIENKSDDSFRDIKLVLDNRYIKSIEQLGPRKHVTIFTKNFHYMNSDGTFGARVGKDIKGEILTVSCKKGKKEIRLVEKKGLFGR